MRWWVLLTCMSSVLLAQEGQALSFCTEPDVPSCAEYLDKSSNGWDFDSCRSELEAFKEELASFIECRQQELRSKVDALLTDYRQAVDRYNCKARGEDFCY